MTCNDCYFRQELLCALKGERVCPTFRATVGRAPMAPRQATLIPVPQPTAAQLAVEVAPPAVADDTAVRALTAIAAAPPVQTVPAAVQATPAPFATTAPESTFTLRETRAAEQQAAADRVDVAALAPARAAAHERAGGDSCIVSLGAPDLQDRLVEIAPLAVATTSEHRTRSRGAEGNRAGRIAQRIAERYPQAQLC